MLNLLPLRLRMRLPRDRKDFVALSSFSEGAAAVELELEEGVRPSWEDLRESEREAASTLVIDEAGDL